MCSSSFDDPYLSRCCARRIGDYIHLPKFWTDGCLCHKIIRGWEPYDVSWTSYHIHQNWELAWLQSGASSSRKLASWRKHKRRNESGVEGRTGAGKSSLVAALQRMPEAQGVLMIDNVPIKGISLQKTRRCISVLDQNPVLFSRSLKKNLDLMEQFGDKDYGEPLKMFNWKSWWKGWKRGWIMNCWNTEQTSV